VTHVTSGGSLSADDPDAVPETLATYLRLRGLEPSAAAVRRRRWRGVVDDENAPFAPGRDPTGLGDALSDLTRESGWVPQLAREDLVLRWDDVAGEDTARHSHPVALTDGTLTIRCDSSAWAKQLQLMRSHILSQILLRHPDAGVTAVRFVGPDVPSWKWGPRAIPGRGPRDTYG
jgi:predicted nucleic acid-binding Zn ribbon protein